MFKKTATLFLLAVVLVMPAHAFCTGTLHAFIDISGSINNELFQNWMHKLAVILPIEADKLLVDSVEIILFDDQQSSYGTSQNWKLERITREQAKLIAQRMHIPPGAQGGRVIDSIIADCDSTRDSIMRMIQVFIQNIQQRKAPCTSIKEMFRRVGFTCGDSDYVLIISDFKEECCKRFDDLPDMDEHKPGLLMFFIPSGGQAQPGVEFERIKALILKVFPNACIEPVFTITEDWRTKFRSGLGSK